MFDALRIALAGGKIVCGCDGATSRVVDNAVAVRTQREIAAALAEAPKYEISGTFEADIDEDLMEAAIAGLPDSADPNFAVHFKNGPPNEAQMDCVLLVTAEEDGGIRFVFAWYFGQWTMAPLIVRVDPEEPEGFRTAELDGFSVTVKDDPEQAFERQIAR